MELFSVTAVARGLVVGLSNKLAEVVEHVVPIKQYKRVLENSVWIALNNDAKKRTQKNRNFEAASLPFRRAVGRNSSVFGESLHHSL